MVGVNEGGVLQDMLFGAAWGEPDQPSTPDHRLRVAALNVQGAAPAKIIQLMQWISSAQNDILVLSEIRLRNAAAVVGELRALGYRAREPDAGGNERTVLVAAKTGLSVSYPPAMDRAGLLTVDLDGHALTIVGVYAPTNGMSAESSVARALWQQQFLHFVSGLSALSPSVITGDLNILEPGHLPANPHFEDHDYAFYDGLVRLGYDDGYRHLNPTGRDHSWSSPRFGSQRLDHTFVSSDYSQALRSCGYDSVPLDSGLSDHRAMITELDLAELKSLLGTSKRTETHE